MESSDGCSSFHLNKDLRESEFSIFMVLKAGGCNLKLKAINAERAGAHLLIVTTDSETVSTQLLSDVNAMSHVTSDIPTLLIANAEIELLTKNYLKSKQILLKFQMPIPRSDYVTVDFYIVPSDSKMYQFLQSFEEYAVKFENKLKVNFNFLKSNNENDANVDKITRIVNCLSYMVLFDVLGTFNEFCVTKGMVTPECLQEQIDAVENKYIAQARRCVQKNEPIKFLEETTLHNNAVGNKKSYVYINGKSFHGTFRADNLFEAICGGFTHAPEYCVFVNNRYTPNTHYHDIKYKVKKDRWITIIVNICLALFLFFLAGISLRLIYDKIYQQILDVKTSEIVRQSVIDYQTIRNNE